LSGVYFVLFFWQQVTKYFALEINFIPFLFYDYMLWFFDQGRFCYTGWLHGFYHVNLILLGLYPVWKVVQNPWLLHVAQPALAVAASLPFYFWTREETKSPLFALLAAFVYLNFRYLQNVLHLNFAVEIFYPLFVFSAVYFASRKREALYYGSVVLGLLVKEDAPLYFGGLGLFYLLWRGHRQRGVATLLLCAGYTAFLLLFFLPWSGSDILVQSLQNYSGLGQSPVEQLQNLLKTPWAFVRELFLPLEKMRTFLKLTSKLLFIPLFSPWIFLVVISLYPLFFHSAGRSDYFFQLSFHYAAAVLPFLFLAFADGWKRLKKWEIFRKMPGLVWAGALGLVVLNGMNLRPHHFTKDDLETIALAKSLPKEAVVVTQGHLLPYLGYRKWNFYLAPPYERSEETREAYLNADYYLFDFEANAYPLSPEALREKAESVRKEGRWKVLLEDHRRLLLQRQ
jgi:uncharacterized membrane protein